MAHSLPTDQVQVKMVDFLPGVWAGINNQAIAFLMDAFLNCQLARNRVEMPQDSLVLRICLLGTIKIWVDATGCRSRNAVARSSEVTFSLGISPEMILQKIQSVIFPSGIELGSGSRISVTPVLSGCV
jgi:hypothetical protein